MPRARVFVEVGPKKALHGLLRTRWAGSDDVVAPFTNHPKQGDVVSFNQALRLYAAGLGAWARREPARPSGVRRAAADPPDA